MLSILASLVFSLQVNVSVPALKCETLRANLDGITVTICGGEVVSRCDASGNCLFSSDTY